MKEDGTQGDGVLSEQELAALRAEGEVFLYTEPFGDYRFMRRLGVGGMGEVFLAKYGSLSSIEKYCVVKTIKARYVTDREYVARFIDEARVVVQLNHRNICQVFDVGNVQRQLYMAMEFVAGRDLRSVQKKLQDRGERLSPDLAVYIVGEMLEALGYAHRFTDPGTGQALHIVHRDVSMQNVMVSFEGEVKLIDFGLASSKLKLEKTEPNMVMGKLGYMSPEQSRGEELDARTDVYSAGVILYELLSGQRFYQGVGDIEFCELVARGGYRPAAWEALDEGLRTILERSLASAREGRYPSCEDFKDDLVSYQLNRRFRAGTKELRALTEALFQQERAFDRRLFQLFTSMHTDPSAKPLQREQTKTVRIASSLLEGEPISGDLEAFDFAETIETHGVDDVAQGAAARGAPLRARDELDPRQPTPAPAPAAEVALAPHEQTVGYDASDLRAQLQAESSASAPAPEADTDRAGRSDVVEDTYRHPSQPQLPAVEEAVQTSLVQRAERAPPRAVDGAPSARPRTQVGLALLGARGAAALLALVIKLTAGGQDPDAPPPPVAPVTIAAIDAARPAMPAVLDAALPTTALLDAGEEDPALALVTPGEDGGAHGDTSEDAARVAASRDGAVEVATGRESTRRPPRRRPKPITRRSDPQTIDEKLRYLERYCVGRVDCAGQLTLIGKRFSKRGFKQMTFKQLRAFRDDVDSCVRRCR